MMVMTQDGSRTTVTDTDLFYPGSLLNVTSGKSGLSYVLGSTWRGSDKMVLTQIQRERTSFDNERRRFMRHSKTV